MAVQATARKVPVSERALIQRINRHLAKDNEQLRASRPSAGASYSSDLGRYYIVDFQGSAVLAGHVDLEKCGRELGVLKPWEALEG